MPCATPVTTAVLPVRSLRPLVMARTILQPPNSDCVGPGGHPLEPPMGAAPFGAVFPPPPSLALLRRQSRRRRAAPQPIAASLTLRRHVVAPGVFGDEADPLTSAIEGQQRGG